SKSVWLRRLCYAWLAQNTILTISVLIRNLHYIDHFSLAGKRIGVVFFLAIVLFGIYSVFVKVKHQKSAFYLFKVNSLSVFVILLLSALPNWKQVIATYNFTHA